MIDDNNITNETTQSTVRPQKLQQEMTLQSEAVSVQQLQMQQQQIAGKECPFCGAINEPEALFCAQCGQPINKTTCPYCGAEMDPDADFCEVCHHYIRKDICSFCGAFLSGNEAYCPECGSPRGGLVCPTCHSLNDFAFCKKCGTALTDEARMLVKEMQQNPDYQEMMEIVQDYTKLENALP
jgi:membrane protease subunit (stomatin/prohibitin family)